MSKIQMPWEDRPFRMYRRYVALFTKSGYRTLSYSLI